MEFSEVVETAGKVLDGAGVVAIVLGALIATVRFGRELRARAEFDPAYRSYRQGLGRAILLGLEFLVAGDIIRTVAIAPSFTSVGVLALIVLVRTFLSYSMQLELTGRWPWQTVKTSS
ncbi:DUF1622 domain-containing protein [Nocardia sp. NPDC059177]|uniref:DUF1622 domain-containing protein n=1 Tax=Nocardia sp. NPDC059177 TaxID=3346759 RepID=UPI00367632F9